MGLNPSRQSAFSHSGGFSSFPFFFRILGHFNSDLWIFSSLPSWTSCEPFSVEIGLCGCPGIVRWLLSSTSGFSG